MKITALACLLGLLLNTAYAETLRVKIVDADGDPVAQAAVYAKPRTVQPVSKAKPTSIIIDQIDKEFVNHLTVVQTGTAVLFPNHDKIRHHVYSFSPAKNFELPLYQGKPPHPILFDKAGAVTLGCNIHDWMSAYVVVVDTPFFAVTDAQGAAQITVPTGDYQVSAWHPQLKSLNPGQLDVAVAAQYNANLTLTMVLKKSFRAIRLPTGLGLNVGYR